jgi:ribosomal-protein-alanine N-acetyltransferase
MGPVRLRGYREGDVEAMYALDLQCFEPVFRFSRRAMRRFAEAHGATTVLAVCEDAANEEELVGFAIVQMEEGVGYVVTLDVASDWRRMGVARQLMEEMEAHVAAAGGAAIELHVFVGNAAAVRFYEAMGYDRMGLEQAFYGRGMDAWVYGKRVAPRTVSESAKT